MNRALVVSLAGLVALSGCETASLTSQYAFPEEGRAYHYGNFCGPGVPERVSEDPALQLEVLNTLVPVDGIDAICRASSSMPSLRTQTTVTRRVHPPPRGAP